MQKLVNLHVWLITVALFTACQGSSPEPTFTERQLAEQAAMSDATQLMLIDEVHKILDAPPPTEDEKQAIAQQALSNMVRLEGGAFIMGISPSRLGGDWTGWKPVEGRRQTASIQGTAFHEHQVRLDTYYVSKYEVTYEDFDAFKRDTGREIRFGYEANGVYKNLQRNVLECCRAPRKPAAADWHEAKAYCEWLGDLTGQPVSLLTEAQWEYAARERGQWLMFATKWGGIDADTNGGGDYTVTVDALSHSMNDLGVYFMSGNLSEWVLDWYDPDYYQRSPVDNPANLDSPATVAVGIMGREQGNARVHRGGNQYYDRSIGLSVNVFNRFYREPEHYSFGSVGIRCGVNTDAAF